MPRPALPILAWLAAAVLAAGCGAGDAGGARVLAFTRTSGFRHADSIAVAAQILPARLAGLGITCEFSEDPAAFADLSGYRAVAFLYTTGNDLIDAAGREELEAFVRGGGGWLGLHSASDTEYEWPFYQDLVVAPFASHPAIQTATVDLEDRAHPATAALPPGRWVASDEWYNFGRDPRAVAGVRVLATLDESTYTGGTMGADHPVIWAHERLGGRALYSELGHVADRWLEPAFLDHVAGGLAWVTGVAD